MPGLVTLGKFSFFYFLSEETPTSLTTLALFTNYPRIAFQNKLFRLPDPVIRTFEKKLKVPTTSQSPKFPNP